MIKKGIFGFVIITLLCIDLGAFAQEGYKFTDVKRLNCSSVKNQSSSSTCWCFSTLSFIEAEMIRMGKTDIPDLSEMFVVRNIFYDKAVKYVRMQGNLTFSGGSYFHDVTYCLKKYGIVPEEVYKGMEYGEKRHLHGEIDGVLKSYLDAVVKNKNGRLSTAWKNGFNGILDAYFGIRSEKFNYKGKEYTPRTFADQVVGLNPDDYVEITSFSHHPFYTKFILEVPDNWMWGEVYNVPLTDLTTIIDNSVNAGYSVVWSTDCSDDGFSYSRNGLAIVPEADLSKMSETDRQRWDKMSDREKNAQLNPFEKPGKEKEITQEMRQAAFDNYETTDDHGMHIIGIAKDQNGTEYYIVKNSWGESGKFNGYLYASKPYVKYKSTSIMVHKNAIPQTIKSKLGL